MAIMYPKNIELYNSTKSEKYVYHLLEQQLPDTFSVFYSVQWVDEEGGKKIESECDFLIFSEQDGFLTCEVKGGTGYKKENDYFILIEGEGERKLRRSPMEQAEESSRYFYSLYSNKYGEKFSGTYGSISIFPFYNVDDIVLLDHRPKNIVFDARDVKELGKNVRKAFDFYKTHGRPSIFSKSQKKNFKDMINKEIATRAAAGSILEAKEYELQSINRIQDNFIYFLKNYNRTFITGGAGTGKTWIAYKFAKQANMRGEKVLITCANEQLIQFFKSLLKTYTNIEILSFNELIIADGADTRYATRTDLLLAQYDNLSFKKYDSIIVDEAQDFDQYQAMIISLHLLDEKSEFRVFYDLTQNIFDKNFKDGFDIEGKPFVLNENLRNTASIYDWAKDKTDLGKDVVTNQIIGPIPEEHVFSKFFDAKKYMESQITNLVDKENVDINSIVILMDHDYFELLKDKQLGRWKCVDKYGIENNEMKISLVENFKGLEANIVFYLHSINTPEKYNYVAYTRPKYYLFNLIIKD